MTGAYVMNNPTLEIVLFKLQEGVSEETFLASAKSIDAWLGSVDGFRQRQLYQDGQGYWIDTVQWDSLEQAHAAAAAMMSLPEGQAFGSLIDGDSLMMIHAYEVHRLN
jgi:hypothetical protein